MIAATERNRRIILLSQALAIVTVGAVVCAWLIWTKPAPPARNVFDRALQVATLPITPAPETSPIVGFGTVRAKKQVKIVPQVNGELTFVHDLLQTGNVISKGELLFEIDSTIYESRVAQAQADVSRLEASLERTAQEQANLDARIGTAEQMLAIEEQDYVSSKELLVEGKVGTQRDLDMVHQKFLRQKDALADLTSRRSIVPHMRRETEAQLDAARAQLRQRQHELTNTKIFCPFDARVEQVTANQAQVVTAHFSIATLTDLAAFELSIGIDPREMRWLAEAIRPEALEQDHNMERPAATVRWSLHGQEFRWRGYVTRFERVDEATRTARLVVEVRDVDMVATVGRGSNEMAPSLAIGMHCQAELPAEPLEDALMVPRHAIYDNQWVYVFEPDPAAKDVESGTLGRRQVPMLRSAGDSVLVDYAGRHGTEVCELHPGELVVISPLIKPVLGMKIRLRDQRTAWSIPPVIEGTPSEGAESGVRVVPAMLAQIKPLYGGG